MCCPFLPVRVKIVRWREERGMCQNVGILNAPDLWTGGLANASVRTGPWAHVAPRLLLHAHTSHGRPLTFTFYTLSLSTLGRTGLPVNLITVTPFSHKYANTIQTHSVCLAEKKDGLTPGRLCLEFDRRGPIFPYFYPLPPLSDISSYARRFFARLA